jgi:hypothetical protein
MTINVFDGRVGVRSRNEVTAAQKATKLDLMGWSAPLPKRLQMSHDVGVNQTSNQKRGEP